MGSDPDLRWLAWKLDPNSSKLNTPLIFELNGPLNIKALSKAVSAYINDFHQAARCYFYEHDGVVEQRFLDPMHVDIEFINSENPLASNEQKKEDDIDLTIHEFCRRPFDLSRPPLFKFGLLTRSEQNYSFIVNFHHVISDAFTGGYLVEKLGKLYNHFAYNGPYPKSVSAFYEDCARQEKINYTLQQKKADLDFWKEKLSNIPLTVDFFFKKQHLIKKTDEANSRHFSLDEKSTLALKQTARKLGTTPFVILSALYALILYRYTNQKYIALSYSVNTRPPGYLDMPGCFVNDVPFIFDFSNTQTFEQLFKASTLERKIAKLHQRCRLMDIIHRSFNGAHLNVSIHEAFLNPNPLDLVGVNVSCKKIVTYALHNDLALFYQLTSDKVEFRLDYRTACFDLLLIDRFVFHFTDIIKRSLSNIAEDINTNDLVHWTEAELLEYRERKDSLVKIRGRRIELTEIESAIQMHPSIASAVVDLCNQKDQENIIAYYTVKKRGFLLKCALMVQKFLFGNAEKEALRDFLKKYLPNHMMPSAYVKLDVLPLMANGKIDKKQLPVPSAEHYLENQVSSVLFDIFEIQLEKLWRDLLDISSIDINDNFFDVGGNSLLAVHLVSIINEKFNVQYSVPWIFENNTIKSQAFQLRKNENIIPPYNPIIPFNNTGSKSPLFLVHPGLAGAEVYSELAKYLDKNIPLYAIDSYNLNSEKPFLKTIEALAQKYIEYVQSVKPKGPYLLGGWSLGGIIAYEMAQQLTCLGEAVQTVYLLDAQLYSSVYLDLIHIGINVKGLINILPADRGQYIASLPPRYLERVMASLKNDAKILKNYIIKPYAGKVSLIKTTQKTKLNRGLIENAYNGWKKNVKNLELIPIHANHFNLMEGEQVKKVADLIGRSQ